MARNEIYREVAPEEFRQECSKLFDGGRGRLRLMFASDNRETGEGFCIHAVFSHPGKNLFEILALKNLEEKKGVIVFPSITSVVPAAHWYERQIADMFGLLPEGHPDPAPLVLHGLYPPGVYPLRRDISHKEIRESLDLDKEDLSPFMEVKGEGICEIPVGPVHAGIIEPGHFRFSAVGETVYYLDARLFFTHKGIEKQFEGMDFDEGVKLAERISGVSSFAHSAAYCHAVERAADTSIPGRAGAIRTFLLELERLYNHLGDIGNMCAGTGFAIGYAKGASLKEGLMRLNEQLTGSRYLRGVNIPGGVLVDVLKNPAETLRMVDGITAQFKSFIAFLTGASSHMERLENAGVLARDIALSLGATGIAARASGLDDDIRRAHPHLYYGQLIFETHTRRKGDVFARMMLRADEAACSLAILKSILHKAKGKRLEGDIAAQPVKKIPESGQALGYVEGPRGSIFYYVRGGGDKNKKPLRVKPRAASFCNWPLMPFAVHGNIVPDFPLINKSFNLSYSGSDA
ncbi:MAG: NADH-quinone oxidoreductase subunit C [Nitrospiraceae bacterium]|nr:NADH-quinone oxidoreductase subunit C [Nitrospiraceae bacterium]